MPPPYIEGFRARILGRIHGQQTVNVIHFGSNIAIHDDLQPLNDFLLALANAILACVVEELLPAVTNEWTLEKVEVLRIFPTISDPIEVVSTTDTIGALGPASHSFAASLVNLRSGTAGRHGRGRMFLPPPGEANVATSDIDGPTLVLIIAFLSCMMQKFKIGTGTEDFEWIVLSRTQAGPNNANFNDGAHPIQSVSASAQVAVMSSRRKGHGS